MKMMFEQRDTILMPISYTVEQTKRQVRAPSGPCPIRLETIWDVQSLPPDTVIIEWFWQVRDYGLRRGEYLTAEAIAYWAQTEYDSMSDEYRHIESVIYSYARSIGDYLAPTEESNAEICPMPRVGRWLGDGN